MSLPSHNPFSDCVLCEGTTSIAASPVAMIFAAPCDGYVVLGSAVSNGTTTGTITVAVKINGSATDIFGGTLTIPAGTGPVNNGFVALPLTGASAVPVAKGDAIVATPSGGTGASIAGAVSLVIRRT